MIISASRRTDIPAFYSQWLMNRLAAGFVKVQNPFNPAQVRQVSLRPQDVDCLVFWTKNPAPMLGRLDTLDGLGYAYYFQFTLTPYGQGLERNLRPKEELVDTFQRLGRRLGRHRVLWRYDPIILNDTLDISWHCAAFERLCAQLAPYTERVTISFVDLYRKVRSDQIRQITVEEMAALARALSSAARRQGIDIQACCEAIDLTPYGIGRAACVDKALVERIGGRPIAARADPGQRRGCGCCQSVDIGAYNSCRNGCVYCYANYSAASIQRSCARHDVQGEFLLGPGIGGANP